MVLKVNSGLALLLLSSSIQSYAGTMGNVVSSLQFYAGAQLGFSASNLGKYNYQNDFFTVKTTVSNGGTSADPAVSADAGLSYQFNEPWGWRSAFQYLYLPQSNFRTQENVSGLIFGPQPLVQGTAVLSTKSNAFFWNNMLQRQLFQNLSLYVQGGVGFSQNSTSGYQTFFVPPNPTQVYPDGNFIGSTSTRLAWNAGVGLWLYANDNVIIDASYTYASFGRIFSGGGLVGSPVERITANLNRSLFLIGAQYKFNLA